MGFNPMMQFIHEEDVAEAVALALETRHARRLQRDGPGRGAAEGRDPRDRRHRRAAPEPVARAALPRSSSAGASTTRRPGAIDFLKYPCTLDGRRFRRRHRLHARSSASKTSSRASGADRLLGHARSRALADAPPLPDALASSSARSTTRMARIPTRLNAYGYDPWGFHTETREARARCHGAALPLLVPRRDARHREHPARPRAADREPRRPGRARRRHDRHARRSSRPSRRASCAAWASTGSRPCRS